LAWVRDLGRYYTTAVQTRSTGFSTAKVEKALKATKASGLQPALDWLFAHADEADDAPLVEETAEEQADAAHIAKLEGEGEAKVRLPSVLKVLMTRLQSLKCSDCGKAFRSTVHPLHLLSYQPKPSRPLPVRYLPSLLRF
jgi:hypothetical protein